MGFLNGTGDGMITSRNNIKDVVSCLTEEVGDVIRTALVDAGIDTAIKDVVS